MYKHHYYFSIINCSCFYDFRLKIYLSLENKDFYGPGRASGPARSF